MEALPHAIKYHIGKIPEPILMCWVTWLIVFLISIFSLILFRLVPGRIQSVFEMFFDIVSNFAMEVIGEDAPRYYPLLLGIFLFICVGNWIGVIPGLSSPTANICIPISLALIVFIYYNFEGLSKHGIKYFKQFMGPPLPPYLFPVNILIFIIEMISHFARPFSLTIRLFCNIFAKEVLLSILALLVVSFITSPSSFVKIFSIAPLLLRPLVIILALLIGFIQALIFLVLSIIYIGGAVALEKEV